MADRAFIGLDPVADFARVRDLCDRAADYVRLETGKDPDDAYVAETLTDLPPGLTPLDSFLTGIERPDRVLAGIATAIRHFYERDEWYLGLLLLDPAERGQGLGRQMVKYVISQAKADGASAMRVAVLHANPRGMEFWKSLGFIFERTPPLGADGHPRDVLRLSLRKV